MRFLGVNQGGHCFSLEIPLALGALDFAGCDEIASFLCQAARRGADQAGSDPAIDRLVADPQLGSRLFRRVHPLLAHASLLVATVDSVDYIKERLKSQPGVWRWLGSGAVRGHNAPSAIEQRDCCTCGTAIFCAPATRASIRASGVASASWISAQVMPDSRTLAARVQHESACPASIPDTITKNRPAGGPCVKGPSIFGAPSGRLSSTRTGKSNESCSSVASVGGMRSAFPRRARNMTSCGEWMRVMRSRSLWIMEISLRCRNRFVPFPHAPPVADDGWQAVGQADERRLSAI